MTSLRAALKSRLHKARRIALLGVGSELRGDDAAGILLAEHAGKLYKESLNNYCKLRVFIGSTAPENLTGEIKAFGPDHVLIVDSADMGKKSGKAELIDPDKIGGLSFCTHSLPPKIITDYLVQSLGCGITIIGIQPKNIVFGSSLSKEVETSIKEISNIILEAMPKMSKKIRGGHLR